MEFIQNASRLAKTANMSVILVLTVVVLDRKSVIAVFLLHNWTWKYWPLLLILNSIILLKVIQMIGCKYRTSNAIGSCRRLCPIV